MSLAPKFAGQKLPQNPQTPASTPHTLEIYLDYTCPFSAKLFATLYSPPLLNTLQSTYASKLDIIFRQQIQPWHPSSTLCHEAAYAILRLSPTSFYPFSAALFSKQKEFFDVNVVHETRNQTYKRLAKIAGEVGVDEGAVYALLEVGDQAGEDGALNIGNAVTNDVKVQVRANRVVGVHVTPTVVLDGIVRGEVESSWGVERWEAWLGENIV